MINLYALLPTATITMVRALIGYKNLNDHSVEDLAILALFAQACASSGVGCAHFLKNRLEKEFYLTFLSVGFFGGFIFATILTSRIAETSGRSLFPDFGLINLSFLFLLMLGMEAVWLTLGAAISTIAFVKRLTS